jgi:hypothetical protein
MPDPISWTLAREPPVVSAVAVTPGLAQDVGQAFA